MKAISVIFFMALLLFVTFFTTGVVSAQQSFSYAAPGGSELSYFAGYLAESADIFIANGDYIQAQASVERALMESPGNELLLQKLAVIREKTGHTSVLAGNGGSPGEWEKIQEVISEFTKNKDGAGLERYMTELAVKPEYKPYALTMRGFSRMGRGNLEGAGDDFTSALATETLAPSDRAAVENALRKAEDELFTRNEWQGVQSAISSMTSRKDWGGLERYYTVLAEKKNRYMPFAVSSRGFLRWSQGDATAAYEDFVASLDMKSLPPRTRQAVEEAIIQIDADMQALVQPDATIPEQRQEQLPEPASANPWDYFTPAQELVRVGDYEGAQALLDAAAELPLSGGDEGVYLYLRGELLRGLGDKDGAYAGYSGASQALTDVFYLSETYWRMAEYNSDKDKEIAMEYARLSAASTAENEWRQIEAGDMFLGFSREEEAISYYETALANDIPDNTKIIIYERMSNAYMRLGDRDGYLRCLRATIDLQYAKSERSIGDEKVLFSARGAHAYFTKSWGIDSYLFGSWYDNGDYLYQMLNEFHWRFVNSSRVSAELYLQANTIFDSKFSGTYFATWNNSYEKYLATGSLSRSFELVIGARVKPLPGVALSIDQVVPVGEDVESDTRAHLSYFWATGGAQRPFEKRWFYASTYNESTYSFKDTDITAFGDLRSGYAFALGDKRMLTPYAGAVWGYGGDDIDSSVRWSLEAGPGIFFRRWYREDRHNAPRSMFDINLQYRFGLSKSRNNVITLTLSNYF